MPCTCCVCRRTHDFPEDITLWPALGKLSADIYPITKNGRLDGQLRAFICASCLRNANESRLQLKSLLSDVRVSRHALDRFMERQEGDRISLQAARCAIIRIFQSAKPIRFQDKYMIKRLINNGGKSAQYHYVAGWILITTIESPKTIMTIERNWHRKLGVDFWYTEET